jgi:hypothetical protein
MQKLNGRQSLWALHCGGASEVVVVMSVVVVVMSVVVVVMSVVLEVAAAVVVVVMEVVVVVPGWIQHANDFFASQLASFHFPGLPTAAMTQFSRLR